jgi:uncharacterized membrane protein YeiH
VSTEPPLLLALDLAGTFAFALNGALTAIRSTRLDVVGVLTLGIITAIGGGIIRDLIIGAVPPATFNDWRYLAVAAAGALIAFLLGRRLDRLAMSITVLDAAGLSLFAVTGASKALEVGIGPVQAVILGAVTGVGGGTIRDMMIQRIPTVMRSELYAIPALAGATITVVAIKSHHYSLAAAIAAALVCFGIRMLGVRLGLNAPGPPTGNLRPRRRTPRPKRSPRRRRD